MYELNGSEVKEAEQNHKYIEKNKADKSEDLSEKISNLPSTPKVTIRMNSERRLLFHLISEDLQREEELNRVQYPVTHEEPESPTYIMEASDPFLDPEIYKRFSICIIDDTLADRLVTQLENIKDVTRDKAVSSITAGENAVYLLVNTFKYLISGWLGLVISLLTILAYGSFGALIFMSLEIPYKHPNEEIYNSTSIDVLREGMASNIVDIVRNESIMENKTDFLVRIKQELIAYENIYSEYMKHLQNDDVENKKWNFWNSFIFAGTIYTTVGYGHICPKTTSGRIVTIVYAIIGIPLFLIVLTSFGKFLTRVINIFWAGKFYSKAASVQDSHVTKNEVYKASPNEDEYREIPLHDKQTDETKVPLPPETEEAEEFNLPVTLALSILILYMLGGAVLVRYVEMWTFFEAFYCVFISMSTIGLGDFVISDPKLMGFSILYIIFGLSLTAMCIDVVQRTLTDMFNRASEKILTMVDESDSADIHLSDIR